MRSWVAVAGLASLVGIVNSGAHSAPSSPGGVPRTVAQELRLLVLSADGKEPSLGAITQALDYQGTPHDVIEANRTELTPALLAEGDRARYCGVIQATDSLPIVGPDGTHTVSALSPAQWQLLRSFEAGFGVRSVVWYAYPSLALGFRSPAPFSASPDGVSGTWTSAGRAAFPYLGTDRPLRISGVYGYLAAPSDPQTVPWVEDSGGHALVAQRTDSDGRETLCLTFDNSPESPHSILLAHGLIAWVSRGVFLGERRTCLSAQVDDVFLTDTLREGGEFRLSGDDLRAAVRWQQRFRARRSASGFRLDLAFNGVGTTRGEFRPDTLTPAARQTQAHFKWISHTFTHRDLSQATQAQARAEIERNHAVARTLRLRSYSPASLVTPAITGLSNPAFLDTGAALGLRFVVSDASIPSHRAPKPNYGLPNRRQPRILMVPRYPTELYFDVSTPDQWVRAYQKRRGLRKTYAELLEGEAGMIAPRVLRGDLSPLMFHQSNLRRYAQGKSLLGDLLERVAERYEAAYNFPFLSPTLDEVGRLIRERMERDSANVSAVRNADGSVTLQAARRCRVPVTGLRGLKAVRYAGEWTTTVDLAPGNSVTLRPQ